MAVFFPSGLQGGAATCAAWSRDSGPHNLLAVAGLTRQVAVFTEQGDLLAQGQAGGESVVFNSTRGGQCERLAWHPARCLLAMGWADGAISFWNREDFRVKEDPKTNQAPVTCLAWADCGGAQPPLLFSGHASGKIGIWKADSQSRPVPVAHCQDREREITHVCSAADPEAQRTLFYYAGTRVERTDIFFCDEKGGKGTVAQADGPLQALLYYAAQNQVVAISKMCTLCVYAEAEPGSGAWSCINTFKLATAGADGVVRLAVTWAGPHVLAVACEKDSSVRMYDLHSEDNFALEAHQAKAGGVANAAGAKLWSVAFEPQTRTLCAGTKGGGVHMWRHFAYAAGAPAAAGALASGPEAQQLASGRGEDDDLALEWQQMPSVALPAKAEALMWSANPRVFGVLAEDLCHVVTQSSLKSKLRERYVAIQVAGDQVATQQVPNGAHSLVTAGMQILGLDITSMNLLVWNWKKAEVFDIASAADPRSVAAFPCEAHSMGIHREAVHAAVGPRVEVHTFGGTVKHVLAFNASQGEPRVLDINGSIMAVATSTNVVRLFRVGGREAKPYGGAGRQIEAPDGQPLGPIESLRVNCNGTKVSLLVGVAGSLGATDPRLFVYDVEHDAVLSYDFAPYGMYPLKHTWDEHEPKLIICETYPLQPQEHVAAGGGDGKGAAPKSRGITVTSLFVTSGEGQGRIVHHETETPDDHIQGLVGLSAPYIYFQRKQGDPQPPDGPASYLPHSEKGPIMKTVMQNFSTMDVIDEAKRKALLDFSFHLSIGNMDDAFKSIKQIKSSSVWESMAQMCIKTKRLDVAEHCLGNMGHTRGARAVREAASLKEMDARVAAVAVHLGMVEEAEKLFKRCERYDLLSSLYQASGKWGKALETAASKDRIHLKSTHYKYAKVCEYTGDIERAIEHFEKSQTHVTEVPRMLLEKKKTKRLNAYVEQCKDKELLRWWAKYCEANSQFEDAQAWYQQAEDTLALVRIHCFRGEVDRAVEIVNETEDAAASFHVARHFDALGQASQAMHFYSRAKKYSHAVRLAKKFGMDTELVNFALQSDGAVMAETAVYFEEKGDFDRAVQLYHKAGRTSKALAICFAHQLFDALQGIADALGPASDRTLLQKCATFFMEHDQYPKAAHLLLMAKEHAKALDLCFTENVVLTEEMAEALTPAKDEHNAEHRAVILQQIAKLCKHQGSYHLACKKYTQAGNKASGMKCLIKSGDTEKICFFASVSRQKELYMMAANYLQTLNWHNDATIMKNIITFYSKAKAYDSISTFYEGCAQIEIDEYRDYEKALQAYREAQKYNGKSRSIDKDERAEALALHVEMVENFVQARTLVNQDPNEMVRICNVLLARSAEISNMEAAIRVGDVYALLVEHWYGQGNMEQAYQHIERMRAQRIQLGPYLDKNMVDAVYTAMGIEETREAGDDDGIGEEIDEDIADFGSR